MTEAELLKKLRFKTSGFTVNKHWGTKIKRYVSSAIGGIEILIQAEDGEWVAYRKDGESPRTLAGG